ncbi:MAG: ANTAR domain-containing protein, partial [Propionibacteriaceae bacterium]
MSDDEQTWASDKREFVADSRDETGDERDVVADARDVVAEARDVIADAREAVLDLREKSLNDAARQLASADDAAAAAERTSASKERDRTAEDRENVSGARRESDAEREAAADRRTDRAEPTLLALAFASIAEHLYDAQTYDEVLTRIAEAAVATISGGDSASVTLRGEGEFRTAASTGRSAAGVDEAQYTAGQGPSLDALTTPMVDASAFPDARWPALGEAPSTYGVESSLSYQLHLGSGDDKGTGSLSIYALTANAFDEAAHEIGSILAAHASVAARAVGDRLTLEDLGRHLEQALLSRDVIGQAKGILMERLKVTPDDAFEILRSS